MQLTISRKKIIRILSAVIGTLVALHFMATTLLHSYDIDLASGTGQLLQKFNLDNEVGIGTWAAQTLLLASGALLLLAGAYHKKLKEPSAPWFALGGIFLYLSLDEGTGLHELGAYPTRHLLGSTEGILTFAWVIPGMLLVSLFSVLFVRFWWRLPSRTRLLFALSGLTYIGGALILEMIGAAYYDANPGETLNVLVSDTLIAVEECLEMVGVTLFIYSILGYLKQKITTSKRSAIRLRVID